MIRWTVRIRVVYHREVTVEAPTRADARRKARRAEWEPDGGDEQGHRISVVGSVQPEELLVGAQK